MTDFQSYSVRNELPPLWKAIDMIQSHFFPYGLSYNPASQKWGWKHETFMEEAGATTKHRSDLEGDTFN